MPDETSPIADILAPEEPEEETPEPVETTDSEQLAFFRKRISACKRKRRNLIDNWSKNVDYRRGKPFQTATDDDQIAVNLDWSFTKSKITALFSQVPQVRISHPPESYFAGEWLPAFERRLNDRITEAGVEAAFEEVLPDCINAAGVGGVLVSYEAVTEDREVPAIDIASLPPQMQLEMQLTGKINGEDIPMETVPVTVDSRYNIRRISPSDLLWEISFKGSDFDNSSWVGHSGRMTWPSAKREFKLTDEDKDDAMGTDINPNTQIVPDIEHESLAVDDQVGFDEIYYKVSEYRADATSYDRIQRVVFLHGRDKPVIDEPWNGQEFDEEGGVLIGALQFPIRILTLSYLTDESIPPSDTAVGRSQVDEINKGRTQIIQQRDRSMPVRWFDVNRVDPAVQHTLMRGQWQAAIPVQGVGDRVIGEVARAGMPGESYLFDTTAKRDLQETWGVGPNQLGSGTGIETRGEAALMQSHFSSKVGRERARVGSFFVGIARVLGGLMCLYEDASVFGEGYSPRFSRLLRYSILADSTVLIDSNQRLERLNGFLNMYGQSGYVQLEPVLKEIATLIGLDPNVVIKAPEPQQPDEPNVSIRFSGTEDLMNPLVLATLMRAGQAPPSDLIEQAKQLIMQAITPPEPEQQELPAMDVPEPPPAPIGHAEPNLQVLPTIMKRSEVDQN
jgi:hypothetical protein